MARKTHHVIPNPLGGWDVKKGGGKKSIKHFATKQDAITFGRRISKNQNSEFIIHKKNGDIQNPKPRKTKKSPPYPPKGTILKLI
ncbi:MAG: DUF2188 domain-containing protein [Desulfobacterales bacterium]|nr:DUF2188 domain-containing protein [Desulfobacterales bacterium]